MREFNMKNRANFSYITGLIGSGWKLRTPRLLTGLLVLAFLFAASSWAANPTALIVWDGSIGESANLTALSNAFAAATPVYIVAASVGLPGSCTATPSTCLSTYKQVWDIRYSNSSTFSANDTAAYRAYLTAGGSLFLGGTNVNDSPSRDTSIATFVLQAGGGTITPVNSSNVESVLPPFTTIPDAVTAITFINSGGSSTTGTGAFINKDTSPADGVGTGIVWAPGTLSTAPLGTLIVVFDANFIVNTPDPNSVAYLANLIGYMNSPPPYITSLTPNSGPVGISVVIAGGNFGATQGASSVRFNGTLVTTISFWSANSITAVVPAGTTTGNVVVTVNGVNSNGVLFTVTATSVPALSEGALILLACCLMVIAAWRMRRSHQPSGI
ncbi:MAG TPA: IPTL-CTERM sorting domain-containing protein [Bryobacteraceae bacterium]|nr:IPTL-CTERM sorting domain-containing protein [Bryobacteraceae bacterium]